MASATPLVSIVTPSFEQGEFLRTCIESVLGQNYANIEYLVLDGGSSDGSVEVLRSYSDRFFWRSERDGGQAAAINEGLRRARGEIVGFLNSDDYLRPGAVAAAVAALSRSPAVDVVYGKVGVIDAGGDVRGSFPTRDFDGDLLLEHCFIGQPATFWRRRLHESFGYFSAEFDHALDYEFWIRLMCGGAKFQYVEEEWACARDHAAAKSQRLRGEIFRQIRSLQLRHLGYCALPWWEQYLRYLRDERGGWWRFLPGRRDERMYRWAWVPYVLWRRRLSRFPSAGWRP